MNYCYTERKQERLLRGMTTTSRCFPPTRSRDNEARIQEARVCSSGGLRRVLGERMLSSGNN
jgi:hypothetical protein